MAFLEFIWSYAVWVLMPAFCLGVALLVWCIVSVVRVVRAAVLVRLPLLKEQTLIFSRPGPVVLCAEGPRFTTRFAGLSYEMVSEDGMAVPVRTTWFHATTSGFSTARMEVRRFSVPQTGNYTLRVSGLGGAKAGDEKHQLVFVKPHLPAVVAHVLGIILSAGLTIGSLVLFLMKLVGVE